MSACGGEAPRRLLVFWLAGLGLAVSAALLACQTRLAAAPPRITPASRPTAIRLILFDAITRQVAFQGADGTWLAGQVDLPPNGPPARPPLLFFIHHSGPEPRDIYQHFAARLVPLGYAVFRFDKRGAGRSGGTYGCCEAEDALAAYQAAVAQEGIDRGQIYIVAQSIGTRILAEQYEDFARAQAPAGVILLSSLLEGGAVLPIRAPVHIIVSDSEPNRQALTEGAVQAHQAAYDFGASYFIAPNTEHTLFDTSQGTPDWSDPDWPLKFSQDAWRSLLGWLASHVIQSNQP